MNDYDNNGMLYIDTVSDEALESGDTMNYDNTIETFIAYRDMNALAPRTEVSRMAKLARYEHALFDGITSSMVRGECSGIVKDFSLRKLWRWERIASRDLHTIDVVNCDNEEEAFAADVIFPWGEIVHSYYYDGAIVLDDWQQIIIDAMIAGESAGRFQDDLGVTWRWCKA
jgi:hypothetical protein